MIDAIYNGGLGLLAASWWTGVAWPVLWILLKIVVLLLPLMAAVAYLTLWERKLLGFMQVRHGPNRVGSGLQPIRHAVQGSGPVQGGAAGRGRRDFSGSSGSTGV